MSALQVIGSIVGRTQKTFTGKKGAFTVATYFVVNGDGRPLEVKSINLTRKAGEKISVPVYMKHWKTERGTGVDLVELVDQN
jgi:hypothetical protein